MKYKTKQEKEQIVNKIRIQLDDLLKLDWSQYQALKKLSIIMNIYINSETSTINQLPSGSIDFPEINRKIVYFFPFVKHAKETFVLKTK